jgi:hypothetical protein
VISRNLAVAFAVAGLSVASVARAEPGLGAQLSYGRAEKVTGCPDRATLRWAVSRRLGYDPFFAAARQTIIVEIAAEPAELVGRVRLVDDEGVVRGARDLRAATNECPELVASLALAISITLDPAAALQDEAALEPAPEPASAGDDEAALLGAEKTVSAPSLPPAVPRDERASARAARPTRSKFTLSARGGGSLAVGLARRQPSASLQASLLPRALTGW